MKHLLLFLAIASAIVTVPSESADAGVLLRSARVRSRVNVRPSRIHLGRTQKSTAVARRINPISRRVEQLGTPDSLGRLQRMKEKHYKKVLRWQRKQERAEQRAMRKREREKRKAERERERQKRLQLRKLRKEERKRKQLAESGADEQEKVTITKSGKGGATFEQGERGTKRLSFWARFWNALTGKGKENQAAESAQRSAERQRRSSPGAGANAPRQQREAARAQQYEQREKRAPQRKGLFDSEPAANR